jgi:very-short-patch-repair endonuclease
VELDGDYHLDSTQAEYDLIRDNYLRGAGFKVLRFWNNDILKEIDNTLKIIYENLERISEP